MIALRGSEGATQLSDLRDHCAKQLARFKIPKSFVVVEEVRRLGNGKADYRWAKDQAMKHASDTLKDESSDENRQQLRPTLFEA